MVKRKRESILSKFLVRSERWEDLPLVLQLQILAWVCSTLQSEPGQLATALMWFGLGGHMQLGFREMQVFLPEVRNVRLAHQRAMAALHKNRRMLAHIVDVALGPDPQWNQQAAEPKCLDGGES